MPFRDHMRRTAPAAVDPPGSRGPATAPALTPPRWSGRKTAVAAALAVSFASAGTLAAAAAMPAGTGASSGAGMHGPHASGGGRDGGPQADGTGGGPQAGGRPPGAPAGAPSSDRTQGTSADSGDVARGDVPAAEDDTDAVPETGTDG